LYSASPCDQIWRGRFGSLRRGLIKGQTYSGPLNISIRVIVQNNGDHFIRLVGAVHRHGQRLFGIVILKLQGSSGSELDRIEGHVRGVKHQRFETRDGRGKGKRFRPDRLLFFPIEPQVELHIQLIEVVGGDLLERWKRMLFIGLSQQGYAKQNRRCQQHLKTAGHRESPSPIEMTDHKLVESVNFYFFQPGIPSSLVRKSRFASFDRQCAISLRETASAE
jgi:hypothetical protein